MRSWMIFGMGALLAACGADPEGACDNYVAAWSACLDEAYADDTTGLETAQASLEGACDPYAGLSGQAAKDAEQLLDCYADTIDAGDCSTPEAAGTTVAGIGGSCG